MKRMFLVSTALAGAIALQLGMEPTRSGNHGMGAPLVPLQIQESVAAVRDALKGHNAIQLPNKELTPGAVRTSSKMEICGPDGHRGTASLRLYNHDKRASNERATSIFSQYALEKTSDYTLDHLIPLGIGGDDKPANIWPQPKAQALLKDKLEFWMRDQICRISLPDNEASELISRLQREIATDWYAAYKHYLPR